MIVADTKGNLCRQYGEYLKERGYDVKCVDFKDVEDTTCGYNPLDFECCAMSYDQLYDAGLFEFPFDDFSPEGRKRVEEQSDESFIKLYNMTASEEGLEAGIQFVNRALQSFDDEYIRRVVEANRK